MKREEINVRVGSWLRKKAKRLKRDRISYSSKTALVVQHAIEFNLEVELKNIILVAFRYFEFLHSQGQSRHFDRAPTTSGRPQLADILKVIRHVPKVPRGDHGQKRMPASAMRRPSSSIYGSQAGSEHRLLARLCRIDSPALPNNPRLLTMRVARHSRCPQRSSQG